MGSLTCFARLGFATVLVTSQSCVGKGLISLEALEKIHQRMQNRLAKQGLAFDGIYVFTGLPGSVNLAKPEPQMILRARDHLDLDLAASWMIGDAGRDIEMARRAGVGKTIRVRGANPVELDATMTVESLGAGYSHWRGILKGKPGNWDFAFEDALELEERNLWIIGRAKHGSPQDLRDLACSYIWGDDPEYPSGFPKNVARARYWYTIAAELGHPGAMWDVAGMWICGEGGPPDVERGLRYLRILAQRPYTGDYHDGILAAKMLAELLSPGGQVPSITPDSQEADYWRSLAERSVQTGDLNHTS